MNLEEVGGGLNGWIARKIMVPTIAEEVIARVIEEAELGWIRIVEWEDFSTIGERDWEQVLEAVRQIAKDIRPPREVFESTRRWLAEHVDKDVV